MKNRKSVFWASLLLLAGITTLKFALPRELRMAPGRSPASLEKPVAVEEAAPAVTESITTRSAAPVAAAPLSAQEQKSVLALADLAAHYERYGRSPAELIGALRRLGLQPVVAQNFNPDTGKMVIVRTENALEGTRNLHFQMFGNDDDSETHMQHDSWEIRPSPDAMEIAKASIRRAFGDLGRPEIDEPNHVLWRRARDCRAIWARRLVSDDDLRDNPFNAHDPATDRGLVWVANEEDPHCHEAPGEHQQ